MSKLPVALQLYTVRDAMEADFEGTLKQVKAMGYDGIEFAGLFGKSAAEVHALSKKYDLVPISAHVPYLDMISDPEKVLSEYAEIGCQYIAIPYLTEEYRPGTEAFDDVIRQIIILGKAAKEKGMQLLYHNHDFEFVKIDGQYGLDLLYSRVPADLLQTELDTCWVNVAGENPVDYIKKYAGRAPVVHLKDFIMQGKGKPAKLYELIGIEDNSETTKEETFAFRPVGYGVQDMPAIINASKESGAKWLVVEQDRPANGQTTMDSARISIDFLKKL